MACVAAITPDTFASGLLGYLDCQATTLGSQGFAALASPGSSVSLLLAALLTLFIAFAGYRMLLGEAPGLREAVLGIVKIGLVLALTTSWPAYRTLVYDVVLRTPAELSSEVGRPAGLPGADGGLAPRLDGVDRSLRILSIYGTGVPTREEVEAANGVAPPLFANFDVFALGMARLWFLVGSLGALALLRLVAGVLLAFGPLFIAFALFAPTRGLTEGWLRGLSGATLASAGVALALGIELALLEPWLFDLIEQRAAGQAVPGAPTALLAGAIVFSLAIAGLALTVMRVTFGLRLTGIAWQPAPIMQAQPVSFPTFSAGQPLGAPPIAAHARSRAAAIADSILISQRREDTASGVSRAQIIGAGASRPLAGETSFGTPRVGRSHRRTARRISAGASARDRS